MVVRHCLTDNLAHGIRYMRTILPNNICFCFDLRNMQSATPTDGHFMGADWMLMIYTKFQVHLS